MIIRFYKKEDYSNLKKLYQKTELYVEPNDSKENVTKQIEFDKESIIIAEENNTIIGSVIIVFSPWESFIFHLAILPEYQNQGIGSKLLNEAEKQLKKKGAKKVSLFVHIENKKLINFYKKRNWQFYADLACFRKEL